MAEVVRYVDPDATGAGNGTSWADAYTSLAAWEAAEQTDLVTDGDIHHVYVRASSGTADTTAVIIDGWTLDADHYIIIEAAGGDEALKTGWDTSRYRLSVTDSEALWIADDCVRVYNLQIEGIHSSSSAQHMVRISHQSASSNHRIDGCRIRQNGGTGTYRGISAEDSDIVLSVTNTIVENTDGQGMYLQVASADIYNCVVEGVGGASGWYGIQDVDGSTVTVKNSAVFNGSDDFQGTFAAIDYCASDDGDGTNAVAPSSGNWANEFSDPANGDFTLLNTGNLYDAGVGPGSDASVPTTDIDGDSRSGATCDIGVDEYVAAGGATIPIMMHHYAMLRGR